MTKVEGQNLVIGAPQKIQKSTTTVAPKNVKAKVAAAKVERGWSGIKDPQVKNQLVQKMKAEDSKNIPPPSIQPNQQAAGGASPEPERLQLRRRILLLRSPAQQHQLPLRKRQRQLLHHRPLLLRLLPQ